MPTYDEAMTALRAADAAGNVEDARKLAGIADKLRTTQKPPQTPLEALDVIQPPAAPDKSTGDPGIHSVHDAADTVVEPIVSLGTGMAAGAVAPVVGAGKELLTGDFGHGTAEKTAEQVQQALTYQPRNPNAQQALNVIGRGMDVSKLAGLNPADAVALTHLASPAGKTVQESARNVAPELGIDRLGMPKMSMPQSVKDAAATLRGSRIKPAKEAAIGATKEAVESGAAPLAKAGTEDELRVKALTGTKASLDAKIKAAQESLVKPDLNKQGESIRSAYTAALQSADAARKAEAATAFSSVKDMAAAKEAQGFRVDVSAAEAPLKKLAKAAEGIPGLEDKIGNLLGSLKEAPQPAPAEPVVWAPPGSRPPPAAAPAGKTFEQLELTRRNLNDIAFSGPMEGYGSIARGAAAKAAEALDKAMQEFVPEFGTYKARYAEMSKPLDSLKTKFGRALAGTEGGLQGDVYAKVDNSALPGRLFAKKDGIDLLVDALAGGKNATAEARAAAAKQVDNMVENWIVESVRTKKPAAAVEHLSSPNMRAALSAVPEVEGRLKSKFGDIAGMERTGTQVKKMADELRTRGTAATETAAKMRDQIKMADAQADMPGKASQKAAYEAYRNVLSSGRAAGRIPDEQYRATLALIDRAQTLEEKTATARRIVRNIAIGIGLLETNHMLGTFIPH